MSDTPDRGKVMCSSHPGPMVPSSATDWKPLGSPLESSYPGHSQDGLNQNLWGGSGDSGEQPGRNPLLSSLHSKDWRGQVPGASRHVAAE